MLTHLKGKVDKPKERTLYWQHLNHSAVREGDWKLVTLDDRDEVAWELYDLSDDRSETDNVIADHPQTARWLKAKWLAWAEDANVLPFPEERELTGHNRLDQIKAR